MAEEWWGTAIQSFHDLYIAPEIRRRIDAGTLSEPVMLRGAQVIFPSDGGPARVRLNSEVKALVTPRLRHGFTMSAGDAVYESDVEGIDGISLPDDEDPDCGHFTLFLFRDRWVAGFDFVYNKGTARRHLAAADEFVQVARYAEDTGLWWAMVDTLFSAAELAAKATVLVLPMAGTPIADTHKAVHSQLNRAHKHGWVPPEQVAALNALKPLRPRFRYLKGGAEDHPDPDALRELRSGVEAMLAQAHARVTRAEDL